MQIYKFFTKIDEINNKNRSAAHQFPQIVESLFNESATLSLVGGGERL